MGLGECTDTSFLARRVVGKKAHCVQVHFLHRQQEDSRLPSVGAQKILETQCMLFARGAVLTSELLKKRGDMCVQRTAI